MKPGLASAGVLAALGAAGMPFRTGRTLESALRENLKPRFLIKALRRPRYNLDRETARRRRQLSRGIIRNEPHVPRFPTKEARLEHAARCAAAGARSTPAPAA